MKLSDIFSAALKPADNKKEKAQTEKPEMQSAQGQREIHRHHRHCHTGISRVSAARQGAPLL